MKLHSPLALLLMIAPIAGHAELSLDGLKASASKAAKSVSDTAGSAVGAAGEVAGKATDAATETVNSTKKDLQDEASPEATRAKLDAMAKSTLARLFSEQPASRELFDRSAGYAVFDTREVSFYAVAGYGRGLVVDRQNDSRTYMKVATGGAGMSFGIGGFDSQIIILFEDDAELRKFAISGMDATAEAGTMAGEKKDQLALRYNEGKAVFVLTKQGWKVGAKMTGSRYWPDADLN